MSEGRECTKQNPPTEITAVHRIKKKINQQNQDQKAPTKLEEAINTEPWQKHQ